MGAQMISLLDLQRDLAILVERHLAQHGSDLVEIDADYYWAIPWSSKFSPYERPSELTIGQLSEDYEFLASALRNPEESGYPLVWLAHVLEAVGLAVEGRLPSNGQESE